MATNALQGSVVRQRPHTVPDEFGFTGLSDAEVPGGPRLLSKHYFKTIFGGICCFLFCTNASIAVQVIFLVCFWVVVA